MALIESEAMHVVDNLNEDNFLLLKFKMKMILSEKELWEIIEGIKRTHASNVDPNVIPAFKNKEKMTFASFAFTW